MTLLSAISKNHFAIHCKCGHAGLVPVQALIDKHGGDIHFDVIEGNARCSKCRTKNIERVMIIYVGASEGALQGAEQSMAQLKD